MYEAPPSPFYFPKRQTGKESTWLCRGAPGEVEMAMKKGGVGRFPGALTSSAHLGRSRARSSPARCPYHRTQGTWSETSLGPGCSCHWCWSSRTLPPWSTPLPGHFSACWPWSSTSPAALWNHRKLHLCLAGFPIYLPLCTFLSFSAGAAWTTVAESGPAILLPSTCMPPHLAKQMSQAPWLPPQEQAVSAHL